jgi:putative nucleotidyltransferase-like protein
LKARVEPNWNDRRHLVALMAAVADRRRAAALPADDDRVVELARRHRLSPLLSATAEGHLPAPLAEVFRRDRMSTVARNMMFGQAAEECIRALAGDGVPSIVLKGLAYEPTIYPGPGTRPTSDVDLLVPHEERRRAFEVLDRLGFEPRAAAPGFDDADYHEVAWTRPGVEVDLHLALAPFARCDIDYRAVWAAAVPLRLGATEARALRADHAAVFHALHMAMDHFSVPAIYLVDLARLLPAADAVAAAAAVARAWRCWRPFATATALAASLLPDWAARADGPLPAAVPAPRFSRRVVDRYGTTLLLPRPEQLLRKLLHFDTPRHALRYLLVQSRRNAIEIYERRVRRRSPRERLALRVSAPR